MKRSKKIYSLFWLIILVGTTMKVDAQVSFETKQFRIKPYEIRSIIRTNQYCQQ